VAETLTLKKCKFYGFLILMLLLCGRIIRLLSGSYHCCCAGNKQAGHLVGLEVDFKSGGSAFVDIYFKDDMS
jgi:hypothetical protein